jgi:hypothetical protein
MTTATEGSIMITVRRRRYQRHTDDQLRTLRDRISHFKRVVILGILGALVDGDQRWRETVG